MKKHLGSMRHVLAGLLALVMVLSSLQSLTVRAEGETYRAYSEQYKTESGETKGISRFIVEDGGKIVTFCLNGRKRTPLAGDEQTGGNTNVWSYGKVSFARLSDEAKVTEFNDMIGHNKDGNNFASKNEVSIGGEELRKWLIAVVNYYDTQEYKAFASQFGITEEDPFYFYAMQQAIWSVTDGTDENGDAYATQRYFINLSVRDFDIKTSDMEEVKGLIESGEDLTTSDNPLAAAANKIKGALAIVEKVKGLNSIGDYEAGHTLLNIYRGAVYEYDNGKPLAFQNLLSTNPVTEKPVPVTVSKRVINLAGKETDRRLGGAVLTLMEERPNDDVLVKRYETTEQDEVLYLYPGTYVLSETKEDGESGAPNGYEQAEPIRFTVANDGTVTIEKQTNDTATTGTDTGEDTDAIAAAAATAGNTVVIMYDKMKKVPVKISKKAVSGVEELPGATLQVLKKEGEQETKVEEWVSGKEPKEVTLDTGDYILREITAPDGYLVAEEITFSIDEEGNVSSDYLENGIITMKDRPTEVTISKTDITGSKEICDAELSVTDVKTGTVVESWKSEEGKSHQIVAKLVAGRVYKLTETTAPDGYLRAESIYFFVNEKNEIYICDENGGNAQLQDGKVVMKDCEEPVIEKEVNHKKPHEDLAAKNEVFTYTIKTEIPKMPDLKTFEVTDELDKILTFAGTAEQVRVTAGGTALEGKAEISGQTLTVRLTENDLTKEMQGKALIVEFTAKIRDDATEEQIDGYAERKIPNKACYKINNDEKVKWSNTVTVTPKKPTPETPKTTTPQTPTPEEPKTPTPEQPTTPVTVTPETPATPVTPVVTTPAEVLGARRDPAETQIVATPTVLGATRAANSPETGDGAPVRLLVALMGVAAVGACAGVLRLRKMR